MDTQLHERVRRQVGRFEVPLQLHEELLDQTFQSGLLGTLFVRFRGSLFIPFLRLGNDGHAEHGAQRLVLVIVHAGEPVEVVAHGVGVQIAAQRLIAGHVRLGVGVDGFLQKNGHLGIVLLAFPHNDFLHLDGRGVKHLLVVLEEVHGCGSQLEAVAAAGLVAVLPVLVIPLLDFVPSRRPGRFHGFLRFYGERFLGGIDEQVVHGFRGGALVAQLFGGFQSGQEIAFRFLFMLLAAGIQVRQQVVGIREQAVLLEVVHDFLRILRGKLLVSGVLAVQVVEGTVIKHGGHIGVILVRETGNVIGEGLDGFIRIAQVRVGFTQQVHGRFQVGAVTVFLHEAFQHRHRFLVAGGVRSPQVEQGGAFAVQGQFIELVGGVVLVQLHDLVRLLDAEIEFLVLQQSFQGQGVQHGGILGIREFLQVLRHKLAALVRFSQLPGSHGQVIEVVLPARGVRIGFIDKLVSGAGDPLGTMHQGLVAHETEREGVHDLPFLLHLVELVNQGGHLRPVQRMGEVRHAGHGAVGASQAVQGMVGVRQHSGLVGQEAHQHHCQGGVVFRLLLLSFLEKGAGFFQHFRNVAHQPGSVQRHAGGADVHHGRMGFHKFYRFLAFAGLDGGIHHRQEAVGDDGIRNAAPLVAGGDAGGKVFQPFLKGGRIHLEITLGQQSLHFTGINIPGYRVAAVFLQEFLQQLRALGKIPKAAIVFPLAEQGHFHELVLGARELGVTRLERFHSFLVLLQLGQADALLVIEPAEAVIQPQRLDTGFINADAAVHGIQGFLPLAFLHGGQGRALVIARAMLGTGRERRPNAHHGNQACSQCSSIV